VVTKPEIRPETRPDVGPEIGRDFRTAAATVPQDWSRLARYLGQFDLRFDPAINPLQFAGGFGNLNFLLVINGIEMVLRRPPLGPIPPGANDMAREYRVLSALHPAFPLAPQAHHLCTDASVIGGPFILLDYRRGLIIREQLPKQLKSTKVGPKLSQTLVDVLVALHAIDPARIGLNSLGRAEGFLGRTITGWAVRAALAVDGAALVPPTEELVTWLRRELPSDSATGPPTLLHNDFKLDNLVLNPTTLAPVAVLDWDMGSRGDPLFDLATLLSYWTEAGDPPALHALRQMPTAAKGFAKRADVVAAYAKATGRDVSNFRFYRVLTMFKLAVVFLQLGAQWRRGTSTNPRFADFDALAADLMLVAHDIAQGRVD
jgi:aminoglycoside phosphotransferase (APT) family kinase protein